MGSKERVSVPELKGMRNFAVAVPRMFRCSFVVHGNPTVRSRCSQRHYTLTLPISRPNFLTIFCKRIWPLMQYICSTRCSAFLFGSEKMPSKVPGISSLPSRRLWWEQLWPRFYSSLLMRVSRTTLPWRTNRRGAQPHEKCGLITQDSKWPHFGSRLATGTQTIVLFVSLATRSAFH